MVTSYSGSGVRGTTYGKVYGTASAAGGNTLVAQKFIFTEPHIIWLVTHNFKTRSYTIALQDNDGRQFFAGTEVIDDNQFLIRMTEPTSGTANVVFFV